MKNILLISVILFSYSISGENFNLHDRILFEEYHRKMIPLLYENSSYSNINNFKKLFESLDKERKKKAVYLIDQLTRILPSEFLRPLIYWKIISPNKKKLSNILSYIMAYKASTFRDAFQLAENKNDIFITMQNIYHRGDLAEDNFFTTLSKDFEQKSLMISEFNDLTNFVIAIKETSSISYDLSTNEEILPYTLSTSGLIPGNQIKFFNSIPLINEDDIFTSEPTKNKAYKKDPLFVEIKKMIKDANQSIFISIKEIDGRVGTEMLKYISDTTKVKLKTNPNFKVLILSHLNKSHRYGKNIFILSNQNSLKIRNEKVIVIDANSDSPIALIGSRSWSNTKSYNSYDNDIWLKGPAAAMIQNSFYPDIKLDLKNSNISIKKSAEIINHFKISKKVYPKVGNELIRIAESSIDNKVNNTRDIIVDMIKKAKSHIFMEQKYLFDTYIINALIKRKIEESNLDIRILADHNISVGLNGLPNTIYLRELKLYNINVKSRKIISLKQSLIYGNTIAHSTENHRNTISVDGNILFTGSASLSPKALQGDSREIGVQIFDNYSIRNFETNFLISWNDRDKVMNLDIENFRVTTNGEQFSKEISSLINAIASSLLKAKDELINKF